VQVSSRSATTYYSRRLLAQTQTRIAAATQIIRIMPGSPQKVVNSIQFPKLQKNARPSKDDELKLELITYENQQKGASSGAGASLSLELIYGDRPTEKGSASGVTAVEEEVMKLEQQQQAMMNNGGSSKDVVELMRGFATGLQTRQLQAVRKHAENVTLDEQEKAVEMLAAPQVFSGPSLRLSRSTPNGKPEGGSRRAARSVPRLRPRNLRRGSK